MKITIQDAPHKSQRYETCGDYLGSWSNFTIRVSRMKDWRYIALVAVHELVEALICRHTGIKETDITKFDKEFEKARAEGNTDEPGDDPHAPYRRAHFIATNIERQLADALDVDWKKYEETINAL